MKVIVCTEVSFLDLWRVRLLAVLYSRWFIMQTCLISQASSVHNVSELFQSQVILFLQKQVWSKKRNLVPSENSVSCIWHLIFRSSSRTRMVKTLISSLEQVCTRDDENNSNLIILCFSTTIKMYYEIWTTQSAACAPSGNHEKSLVAPGMNFKLFNIAES